MTRSASSLFLLLGMTGACTIEQKVEPEDSGDTSVDDTAEETETVTYDSGCITVNGEGGYAHIADAVAVAEAGAVIAVCAGTYEEAVTVDKAVNIQGEGLETTTLVAPTNEAGFTISADGAIVSGFAIESTRSGVVIEGASGVSLVSMAFLAVDNYGVKATDAAELSISGCTFNATGYGGVEISGGTAEIQYSTFEDNTGFGIHGSEGAVLSVGYNTISDTQPTDADAPEDGHGVWVEEADASLVGNTLTDNLFVGVYAQTGDLTLDGDSITGSLYGVAAFQGDFSASGVVLTNNGYYGVFAASTEALSVSGATVTGEADAVIDVPTSRWGDRVDYQGSAVFLASPVVNVTDSTIDGYNNAGLVFGAYDDSGCVATLTNLTLQNNGRIGLFAISADVVAENVNITGLIEVEDAADEQCFTVGSNAAASFNQSSVTWTGGSVIDNDGYGLASLESVLTVSGALFSGNSCAGVMNFGGTLIATGNTLSGSNGGSFEGSLVSYEASSSLITENLFTDNQVYRLAYSSESDDGAGNIYRYDQYQYDGSDIQLWRGGEHTVEDNVFENGTESVYAYDADATVSHNSWSGYRGTIITSASSAGTTVSVEDATVDDFYSYGVLCSSAGVDIKDATFTNGGTFTYALEAFLNDEPYYSYESSYANPVLYGYNCTMAAEEVSISETSGHVLRSYGGSYEISDLEATDVGLDEYSGYDALYFYAYLDTDVYLTDVSISGVTSGGGMGIYVYADVASSAYLNRVEISDTSTNGLKFNATSADYDNVEVELEDVILSDLGAYGLYAERATIFASNMEISDSTSSGIYLASADLRAEGLSISDSASTGAYVTGSSLELTDSSIVQSASTGLSLDTTTATVTGNTITGNAGYGMVCTSVTFDACGNDLSDNGLGTQSGCDSSCETPTE